MVVTSYDSISSVTVVDLNGLPRGAQEQVYAASSRMSEDDLSALRQAVGDFPMALSALKAKELDASNVVVAVIDGHGRLLLVTSATI
jgi:hypothetical protein